MPVAPPMPAKPTPPPEQSVDDLLNELERVQAQKAALEKSEQEVKATLRKKHEQQTERLNKLGVAAPAEPDRVGRILIEGNTKTTDEKILDLLGMSPGQVLQYPKLEAGRTQLVKAGFPEADVSVCRANSVERSRTSEFGCSCTSHRNPSPPRNNRRSLRLALSLRVRYPPASQAPVPGFFMPLPVALSLIDVTVRYGTRVVVDGVSLDVRRGEIVGLLGPNGSGKSTTLLVAAGALDPASGRVAVEGYARAANPGAFASRIGLVPQEPAVYDELTAADNLTFFGELYGLAGHELRRRVARVLSRMQLTEYRGHRVSTFSGGMKQRLNLAAALLHDPTVLLLDEPTASLDPACRDALFADLTRFRDDGHAILLTTHHVDEVESGCDRVAVLEKGKLVACGAPADLLRTRPTDRAVLYGQLRTRPPKYLERAIRRRLAPRAELEITGRRLRLSAETSEDLGHALASVLADGIDLEAYRTPSGALELALRKGQSERAGTGTAGE